MPDVRLEPVVAVWMWEHDAMPYEEGLEAGVIEAGDDQARTAFASLFAGYEGQGPVTVPPTLLPYLREALPYEYEKLVDLGRAQPLAPADERDWKRTKAAMRRAMRRVEESE